MSIIDTARSRRFRMYLAATALVAAGFALYRLRDRATPHADVDEARALGEPSSTSGGDDLAVPLVQRPESPAVPSAVASTPGSDRPLHVFDVFDSSPVPGLAFKFKSSAPKDKEVRRAVTDERGWLRVPPGASDPTPLDRNWRVVRGERDADQRADLIWVGRSVRVHGVVSREGPVDRAFDARSVSIVGRALAAPDLRMDSAPGSDPTRGDWLRTHGLSQVSPSKFNAESGRFELIVPRVRWFSLGASVAGWRTDPIDLSERLRSSADDLAIDLVLRPTRTISGRLIDPAGVPIAGARARVQVRLRSTARDVNLERLDADGFSFTVMQRPSGDVWITFVAEAVTEADGRYSVDMPIADGDASLALLADGRTPIRSDIGRPAGDSRQDAALAPRAELKIALSNAGSPIFDARVLLTDITDRNGQLLLGTYDTDHAGRLDASALELGRDYALTTAGFGTRFFRWARPTEIDLSHLESSLTVFDRAVRK